MDKQRIESMCPACKQAMIELLDERIRRTLEVGKSEGEEEYMRSEAQCFHFMELQRILRGEPTCGVYDDFGGDPNKKLLTHA